MDPAAFRETASGHPVTAEGGHPAFMPAPLPPRLKFTSELAECLSAADAALGELSALSGGRRDPRILIVSFLRQEAVLSSRIEGTRARVYGRLAALPEAIGAEEKSVGWLLRARVGRRVAWRRTIEDTEGTDVIAPERDWRRDLG